MNAFGSDTSLNSPGRECLRQTHNDRQRLSVFQSYEVKRRAIYYMPILQKRGGACKILKGPRKERLSNRILTNVLMTV